MCVEGTFYLLDNTCSAELSETPPEPSSSCQEYRWLSKMSLWCSAHAGQGCPGTEEIYSCHTKPSTTTDYHQEEKITAKILSFLAKTHFNSTLASACGRQWTYIQPEFFLLQITSSSAHRVSPTTFIFSTLKNPFYWPTLFFISSKEKERG